MTRSFVLNGAVHLEVLGVDEDEDDDLEALIRQKKGAGTTRRTRHNNPNLGSSLAGCEMSRAIAVILLGGTRIEILRWTELTRTNDSGHVSQGLLLC